MLVRSRSINIDFLKEKKEEEDRKAFKVLKKKNTRIILEEFLFLTKVDPVKHCWQSPWY